MPQHTPARKALTVLCALAIAGIFLWFAGQVFVISGTKASFSFVTIQAAPAGGPAGGGNSRTTTTTTATTTTSTTTTSATTGGR